MKIRLRLDSPISLARTLGDAPVVQRGAASVLYRVSRRIAAVGSAAHLTTESEPVQAASAALLSV